MTYFAMSHYLIPEWPCPDHIKCASTLRFGGHSDGALQGFNLSPREPEQREAVLANRQQLREELALPNEPLWLHQVHGNHVIQADRFLNSPTPVAADASFTRIPGVVCSVLTADCLPVLLCNQQGTQVAAVHAGWRGLAAGILENAVAEFENPNQILAWLGPAIGPTAFEVGEEVRSEFLRFDTKAAIAFTPKCAGKWLADLYLLAKQRLQQQGVSQIYGGNFCTYTDTERFYSYRRKENVNGRMATLIYIV